MRLLIFLVFLPCLLSAQSAVIQDDDVIWTAEVEQDWVVDNPSLEEEWSEGVMTVKLLRQDPDGYASSVYLSELLLSAVMLDQVKIYTDVYCIRPTTWDAVFRALYENPHPDPVTGAELVSIGCRDIDFSAFKVWRLHQVLAYHRKSATWSSSGLALAPLLEIHNDRGDSIGLAPMFWLQPDNRPQKLTSNHITWAKRTRNITDKTRVPIRSAHLLSELRQVVEQRLKIPLYDEHFGEYVGLNPEERRSFFDCADTLNYRFSEGSPEYWVPAPHLDIMEHISELRLLQTWYWDKPRRRLSISLEAVAPVMEVLGIEGEVRYQKPLFYRRVSH